MSNLKKRIRVSFSLAKTADAVVVARGQSVVNGMTGNPAYPGLPIDPASLKSALESYSKAIGDAVDGGKKAIAERSRQREAVVGMLRILSQYVESACNDDMATFLSSGFEPLTTTRAAPQPLEPAAIRRVAQGNIGQLLVKVASVTKARSYELRYASLDAGGAPGPWTYQPITAVASPTSCNGLTPGATYAFQVRALGRLGFTDWSHSVTKMCT
jgi:hypothetical protein